MSYEYYAAIWKYIHSSMNDATKNTNKKIVNLNKFIKHN